MRGIDVPKMDPFPFHSDPYVILNLGNAQRRSTIKSNTLNPSWNEDFQFYVKGFDDCLEMEVRVPR